jgi:Flp pilus assembly protein TadG
MKLRKRQRGNSIIEFSLMAPWLIMLFVGAMDWGFYAYALIATESAARVGALYASTSTSTRDESPPNTVCLYALDQLRKMGNVGASVAPPCATGSSVTASQPVGVAVTSVTSGPDGNPAVQVAITYLTPVFIPQVMKNTVVLPKQVTITRTIQMRLRG